VLGIHDVHGRWFLSFVLASSVSVALAAEAPPRGKLAAHPLHGPYARLDDFCEELQQRGLLRCSSPLARLDRRGASGARIDEARVVPLVRARGGRRPVEAAIALKVRGGWFVDLGGAEARASKPGDAKVVKQVVNAEWLDDLGAGILGVSVTRSGEFRRVTQEGGGTVELSSELDEADRRFCGLDSSGVPVCTSEILERCNGGFDNPTRQNDYAAELGFESDDANLSASVQGEAGPSCAFGTTLRDGRYALPFANLLSPAERSGGALRGPYASLESYCTAIRQGTTETCALGLGRWNRIPKTLGARPPSTRVHLIRVKDNMAGLTVEYCRLGIEAVDGWYFTRDDAICQGTFGDMATAETDTRSLVWVAAGSDPAFVLATRRQEEHGDYGVDPQRRRALAVALDTVEHAELCVVPKTGAPRCVEYLTACRDSDGTWREAHWSLERGALKFSASEQVECDSGMTLGSLSTPAPVE
jgi:hypothetical protein